MTRTYGALGWARDPEKGTAWFALDVEPHVQTKIRATVSPAPYVETVRQSYHAGWRSRQPA